MRESLDCHCRHTVDHANQLPQVFGWFFHETIFTEQKKGAMLQHDSFKMRAGKESRTPTPLRAYAPETYASTNSAIPASILIIGCKCNPVSFFPKYYFKKLIFLLSNWLAWSRLRQKSGHFLPEEADFVGRSSATVNKNLRSMAENRPFWARQRAT